MFFFFFFSSRRRHTRYWRDWSSDVCSSDLRLRSRVRVGNPPMEIVSELDRLSNAEVARLLRDERSARTRGSLEAALLDRLTRRFDLVATDDQIGIAANSESRIGVVRDRQRRAFEQDGMHPPVRERQQDLGEIRRPNRLNEDRFAGEPAQAPGHDGADPLDAAILRERAIQKRRDALLDRRINQRLVDRFRSCTRIVSEMSGESSGRRREMYLGQGWREIEVTPARLERARAARVDASGGRR